MNHDHETLDLTPDELCALIQGLRGQICNRLYWMVTPGHPIRTVTLGDEVEVLDSMVQAYSKAMMVARDSEHIVPEFKEHFMLSDLAWSTIDLVTRANKWEEIPIHTHGPLSCPLCEELILAV